MQLANYGDEQMADLAVSSWAEIREAQYLASRDPNAGLATAIDIGEADDIHPRNKKDLGFRLACAALRGTYSRAKAPLSPVLKGAQFDGDRVYIELET